MTRLPALSLLFTATLLFAACGGGGTSFENTPGGTGATGGAVVQFAVVSADIDMDGASDVLEIPLGEGGAEPDEPARCWRGGGDGFKAADDWREHPLLDAIRRDLGRRSEQDILDDEGAHHAHVAGGGAALPYAVLHLEAPGDGPDIAGDPIIDALVPDSGHAGALVGIRGTDLASRHDETTVTFDALSARVLLALPRFVLAVVPDAVPLGTVDVIVSRAALPSAAAGFEVVAAPTPVVTEVRPDPVVPGILAVLSGEHLGTPGDDVDVTFGGMAAEHVLPLGRKLIAEVPQGAVSGLLIVSVNGIPSAGVSVDVASDLDAPLLTSVTPSAASAGSLVEIEGEDLFVIGQRPAVRFGTARATVFGRTRDGIVAVVPSGADGDVTVSLKDRTSNGLPFSLLARGAPAITAVTPATGGPGDLVTIAGTDLVDLGGLFGGMGPAGMPLRLPRVNFGERRAFLAFPTPEGLQVMVPFGLAAGTVDVTVERGGDASNAVSFTVE